MVLYVLTCLGSFFLVLMITPVVIRLARRLNIVDVPGPRHMHAKPMSHIGGVAIFVSMMSTIVSISLFSDIFDRVPGDTQSKLLVLMFSCGFMFLIGLIDDVKTGGLRVRLKLLAQVVAAAVVCGFGIRIRSLAVADWFVLDLGWLSWPITLFWIVGITNAINLCDGLDGLAAGIAAIACGAIAVFAFYSGNAVVALPMLVLLGSLTGFLFFNFHPAKVFMGDCGSMFLGFTISSASVLCLSLSPLFVGFALPMLAMGIPITDTLFSILRRSLERRSVFAADRGHFHHRLIDCGLTQSRAVGIAYAVTLVVVGLGLLMLVTPNGWSLVTFGVAMAVLLISFSVVCSVRPREVMAAIGRKRRIRRRQLSEVKSFDEAVLYFQRVRTFDQWWEAISIAADKMQFSSVSLPLIRRDGTSDMLIWRSNNGHADSNNEFLEAIIPARDRRRGSLLHVGIEIQKNGSLESAGRRVALFSRLMEEFDIVNLSRNGRSAISGTENKRLA